MGPITRSVEDAAIAMTVLAGRHPADPLCASDTVDFRPAVEQPIAGMRIAFTEDFGTFPVADDIRAAVREAAFALAEAGATIEEAEFALPGTHYELAQLWCRLMSPLNLDVVNWLASQGLDLLGAPDGRIPPELVSWTRFARDRLTLQDHMADLAWRTRVFEAVQSVMSRYDAVLSPTLACDPVANDTDRNTLGPSELGGEQVEPLIGWCLTYLANMTGQPAATVPAGLSRAGLPVGMQIMGRMGADRDVFAISAAFERIRPWLN